MRLGDGDLNDNAGVQRRLIRHTEIHPKYLPGKGYYNVALLTIGPPANISGKYVRPICLPKWSFDAPDEFEGDQMDAAGMYVL